MALTAERLRELLHYDPETGIFTRRVGVQGAAAGSVAGCPTIRGYIKIGVDYRQYTGHRLAVLWMTGDWPKSQVDHANGVRTDNRWCNLREATNQQNSFNARISRNNTSGYKGVTWDADSRRWRARLQLNRNTISLGLFDAPIDAHAAYIAAAKESFGEFARGG